MAATYSNYDVIIAGGAMMGSSVAWHLSRQPGFSGRVLVVEADPSHEFASTTHTNSCIRQQFSTPLNIRVSQYAAEFLRALPDHFGPDTPPIHIREFGYLYLAGTADDADRLRRNAALQRSLGAATEILSPAEIAERYPFYDLTGILLGTVNRRDEGYWDGAALFGLFARHARRNGVEYVTDTVTALGLNPAGTRVEKVALRSGATLGCGHFVNATGPRAAVTAKMAGIDLPVEPRKRFTWVFRAAKPLDRALPLTVDPGGFHVRDNGGGTYMCGAAPDPDGAVGFDDFAMDHAIWPERVWPALAARIPQFDTIRVQAEWAGHYAMNVTDRNAIVGPHDRITNFLFINGFSGHGLQQAPAMGRAVAEWIAEGEYRTLDMTPFGFARLPRGGGPREGAVI